MPLVGDIIMQCRGKIPDMPQIVSAGGAIASAISGGVGNWQAGTYYISISLITPWGESTPGPEFEFVATANSLVTVIFGYSPSLINIVSGYRIWFSTQPGYQAASHFVFNTKLQGYSTTAVMIDPTTSVPGSIPTFNRSYSPDTDGQLIGAFTMYSWLNEALDLLSSTVGGIQDVSGIMTNQGQPNYQLVNRWIKLTNIWYDGWELMKGRRSDIFYRNAITAISELAVTLKQDKQSFLEIYPQPDRTAGQTTLANQMQNIDIQMVVVNPGTFVLPFGIAMLGNYLQYVNGGGSYPAGDPSQLEFVAYANIAGTTFTGLIRGLGGTDAQDWPPGTFVTECNLRFEGYRMAPNYSVGDATEQLAVPYEWGALIPLYMDSNALDVQGDKSGAQKKRKEFMDSAKAIASSAKLLTGPVQIGAGNSNEIYNAGLGGGWLIP